MEVTSGLSNEDVTGMISSNNEFNSVSSTEMPYNIMITESPSTFGFSSIIIIVILIGIILCMAAIITIGGVIIAIVWKKKHSVLHVNNLSQPQYIDDAYEDIADLKINIGHNIDTRGTELSNEAEIVLVDNQAYDKQPKIELVNNQAYATVQQRRIDDIEDN